MSYMLSGAGPIEFKGIQLNTHYFLKKSSIYSVYMYVYSKEMRKQRKSYGS